MALVVADVPESCARIEAKTQRQPAAGDGYNPVPARPIMPSCPRRFAAAATLALTLPLAAQRSLIELVGAGAGDGFGAAVAAVGDLDGDGICEVIVGATEYTAGLAGHALVFSGATGTLLFRFDGDQPGDRFGTAVAGSGDVDGDGIPDIAVGAAPPLFGRPGYVRVFSGSDGRTLHSFSGDLAGDGFGVAVSGAGDVNADGFADIAVGTLLEYARVLSGRDGNTIYTFGGDNPLDWFGQSVGAAGDVDGDSFGDVVVGASQVLTGGNGYARVFSGRDGTTIYTFGGDNPGDAYGFAVDGAGDVDGDGLADLVIGAPQTFVAGAGYVQVRLAIDGSAAASWSGDEIGDLFGQAVGGAGDLDGDGLGDVIGGAPQSLTAAIRPGYVRTLSAAANRVLETVRGVVPDEQFGSSVAAADLDGDGLADAFVGAPGARSSPTPALGRVRVLASPSVFDSFAEQLAAAGSSPQARLGTAVDLVGDLDGDGFDDIAIGAPFADESGLTGNGRVDFLSGADGSLLGSYSGTEPAAHCGSAVAGVGDVDLDGTPDIAIGCPDGASSRGTLVLWSYAKQVVLYASSGAIDDRFARSVAAAGDVNNDGYPDIIGGALPVSAAATGYAVVVSGEWVAATAAGQTPASPEQLHRFAGDRPSDAFGFAVAGAGDADGDGFADVVVGAPGRNAVGSGYARVLSGRDGTAIRDHTVAAEATGHGWAVACVGDYDGDGREDVAVGAPADDIGGVGSGSVRVYSGATGTLLLRISGQPHENFGAAVGGAGDADGDGTPDFVVGAPNMGRFGGGTATLFAGGDGSVIQVLDGPVPDMHHGQSVAGGGDTNGDGLTDLLVGAPRDQPGGVELAGSVRSFTSVGKTIAKITVSGAPCAAATGTLARIGITGWATIGSTFEVTLSAAPPTSAALMVIGQSSSPIDLGFIGAPGCATLLPADTLPLTTSPIGAARISLQIPTNLYFIGATLRFNWAVLDGGANQLGIITSDRADVRVGQP